MPNIIVLGLGAMGSATAQHLAQRGHAVLGFDQFTPPHTHGSSHGETRIIRQAYWEDWRYVPLLLRAWELWRQLEADTGQSLLQLTGGLMIGRPNSALVQRSTLSAEKFNLPHEILSRAEVQRRHPAFHLREDMVALWEENAGYLNPEACVQQQLDQAARHGADLHCNEPVTAWEAHPSGGVTVTTPQGQYSADHLVITAGPWAGEVLAALNLPLTVLRQVVYWFEPQAHAEYFDRLPIYIYDSEDNQPEMYGFPSAPGSLGVKVALHGAPLVCTPATVDRSVHADEEQAMRRRLATTMPLLNGRLLRAETCLYTMTPDKHFLIDRHPHHPQVSIAAGFSGHGFKFANVMGEILANMATGQPVGFDLGLFSLNRFLQPATR
jgi:sarcosine oxidase